MVSHIDVSINQCVQKAARMFTQRSEICTLYVKMISRYVLPEGLFGTASDQLHLLNIVKCCIFVRTKDGCNFFVQLVLQVRILGHFVQQESQSVWRLQDLRKGPVHPISKVRHRVDEINSAKTSFFLFFFFNHTVVTLVATSWRDGGYKRFTLAWKNKLPSL